jgi:hypothetical protein
LYIDIWILEFGYYICSEFGSPASSGRLKGKPVKIWRYPRSCKAAFKGNFSHTTVLNEREGEVNAKPEDLPGLSTIIQSFRVKGMECKSRRAFIFRRDWCKHRLLNFPRKQSQQKFFLQ